MPYSRGWGRGKRRRRRRRRRLTWVDDADDACTVREAVYFRQMCREVGPLVFLDRTLDSGAISAPKLLTAFGLRLPRRFADRPASILHGLVLMALSHELCRRPKLPYYNSVDDVVTLLRKCNNIIVVTGAGVSTSLGIPDFRSKGTGLYSRLSHLGLSDPQEAFDINVFREDPTIFYSTVREIVGHIGRFSPTHAFIALLQRKGKLLTNYSQNIDNIEALAGILPSKLVQCHGSFATASCVMCSYRCPGDDIMPTIQAGRIPRCPRCAPKERTTANSRKRKLLEGTRSRPRRRAAAAAASTPQPDENTSESEYDVPSNGGVMKPDITFFGEDLPDDFSRRLTEVDKHCVDLLIVIGTSLAVAPVSNTVRVIPSHVPQIYISLEPVRHVNFDIDLLGPCDVVVAELCRRAGWDLHHDMIPPGQTVDVSLEEGYKSRHRFRDTTNDHKGVE